MAITHTGGPEGTNWDFDLATGIYNIGSTLSTRILESEPGPNSSTIYFVTYTYGTGGTDIFTINGGDSLELESNDPDFDPHLGIGTGTGADGTVIVDGAGSSLSMLGAGKTDQGVSLQIGMGGGTGVLSLTNGGSFSLFDDSELDGDIDKDFLNGDGAAVGRGVGSDGTISVAGGSSFELIGGAAGMTVGRNGGTGLIDIAGAGSTFIIRNTADEVMDGATYMYDADASINIGRGKSGGVAGEGTFRVDAGATATIGGLAVDGQRHSASMQVGREGGNGLLEVLNGGTLNIHAPDGFASLAVGLRDQGVGGTLGTLNIDDGTVDIFNQNGGAGTNIGINGATGVATIENGGKLSITAQNIDVEYAGVDLTVGGNFNQAQGAGGDGTLTVQGENSAVELNGGGDGAQFFVGRGGGTTGMATFQDDATLTLEAGFTAIHVGQDGGEGQLDILTGAIVTLTGPSGAQMWIGSMLGEEEVGDGEVNVGSGGKLLFTNVDGGYIGVGGIDGAKGLLSVSGGGEVDLGGGWANVWSSGAGGSAQMVVDGAGSSITGVGSLAVGRDDVGIPAGATGRLTVSNGGSFGNDGAIINFATGGILSGRGGTVIGDIQFNAGGRADFRDNAIGTMTIDGSGTVSGSGNAAFFDVGTAGNDRVDFSAGFHLSGGLAVTLNAIGGYKFIKGQTKTIATFADGDTGPGAYSASVTGQQADFSYYFGKLGTNLKNVVVQALNNGNAASAANAGVLDYGTAGAGKLVYNAVTQQGTVTGGKFGIEGGFAVKLDDIRGTNGVDNFSVTGATARTLKFDGKGGNDIIKGGAGSDTILGGIGNDTLTGNAGNDILQGDVGKDTMTGNAGSDTFKFTLKTHSSASHATADIITDFDDGGTGDKIDVSALFGPKMEYIHAAAFTKAGQVRINDIAGADVIVEVNLTGVSGADFAIRLKATTLASMGKDDFVL